MENANKVEIIAFTEEKKKYDVKIEIKNNKLIISTSRLDKLYKIENDYEKLRTKTIFMVYDNIYEIYEAIMDYIKINTNQKQTIYSIIKEKEKSLLLTIPISLGKFKEINFELMEENFSQGETSQNLNDRLNYLQNLVEMQNQKIETLNQEMKEIKKELDKIKNKKEVYGNTSSENNNLLIQKNEYDLIYNWILPNTNIKFELIYKASVDGDNSENFHKKSDNVRKPTLVVVRSKNGYRFGGYTTGNWGIYQDQEDPNAFVFSLTNKHKVNVQSPKEPVAISPEDSLGPKFGNPTIEISSNCFSNNKSRLYYDSRYKINANQFIGIDTKDTVYFTVDDYEVYKVIFN